LALTHDSFIPEGASDGFVKRPVRGKRQVHREHSRYDQALFAAKNANKLVKFCLAVETYFTDEDCTLIGYVDQVDKYDVAVRGHVSYAGQTLWLKKAMIVSTEVLS
jgi:hypothetical protein